MYFVKKYLYFSIFIACKLACFAINEKEISRHSNSLVSKALGAGASSLGALLHGFADLKFGVLIKHATKWMRNSIYNLETARALLNTGCLFPLWKRNRCLRVKNESGSLPYRKGVPPSPQACLLIWAISHKNMLICPGWTWLQLLLALFQGKCQKGQCGPEGFSPLSSNCFLVSLLHCMSSNLAVPKSSQLQRVLKIQLHWPHPWRL